MDIINKDKILSSLIEAVTGIDASKDELMSNHTSFKIGGPADIFISPKTEEEVISSISFLCENKLPYTVIGNGSNLLVSDEGIRGCVALAAWPLFFFLRFSTPSDGFGIR